MQKENFLRVLDYFRQFLQEPDFIQVDKNNSRCILLGGSLHFLLSPRQATFKYHYHQIPHMKTWSAMSITIFAVTLLFLAGCASTNELKGKTLGEIQKEASESDDEAAVDEDDNAMFEEVGNESTDSEESLDSDVAIEPQEGERLVENESAAPIVDEVKDDLVPITILTESTTFKTPEGEKTMEAVSLFGNVRCKVRGAGSNRALGSASADDELSFTLTNRDERDYFLGYYRKGLEYADIPPYSLRILVNGRKINDLEQICGTLVIKAGETIECRKAHAVIKTGDSFTGPSYDNKLEADSTYVSSKTIFTCDEEKE